MEWSSKWHVCGKNAQRRPTEIQGVCVWGFQILTAIDTWWQATSGCHQTRSRKIVELLQGTFKTAFLFKHRVLAYHGGCLVLHPIEVSLFYFLDFRKYFDVVQVDEQLTWNEHKLSLSESTSMAHNEAEMEKETQRISYQSTVRVFVCFPKQSTQIIAGKTHFHL